MRKKNELETPCTEIDMQTNWVVACSNSTCTLHYLCIEWHRVDDMSEEDHYVYKPEFDEAVLFQDLEEAQNIAIQYSGFVFPVRTVPAANTDALKIIQALRDEKRIGMETIPPDIDKHIIL